MLELLAVIVILAIIALIAVPIVIKAIDKAKVGSINTSVRNYVDAVEKEMIASKLTTTPLNDTTVYSVDKLKNNIELKNNKIETGYVVIDQRSEVTHTVLCINNKTVTYI